MAQVSYDRPTRTASIVLTVREDAALALVTRTVGPQAFKNMLETWFIQQIQAGADSDRIAIKSRLEQATATELDAVKTALGVI